jgi:hypothetical protein
MNLPPIAGLSYKGYFPAHVTNGVDYAWLVGLVVAGVVYPVLSRSLDLVAEQSAIEASERELQAIDIEAQDAAITEQARGDVQGTMAGALPDGAPASSRRVTQPGARSASAPAAPASRGGDAPSAHDPGTPDGQDHRGGRRIGHAARHDMLHRIRTGHGRQPWFPFTCPRGVISAPQPRAADRPDDHAAVVDARRDRSAPTVINRLHGWLRFSDRRHRSAFRRLPGLAGAPKLGKPGPGRPPGSKNRRPAARHNPGKPP